MTAEETDLIAAEYALGTLAGRERDRVAQALEGDGALRRRVEAWEHMLARLDPGAVTEAPSAGLWARVDSAVDRRIGERVTRNTILRSDDDTRWLPVADGIEKKVLYLDRAAGMESYLLRLAPGVSIAGHGHTAVEECLVLSGAVSVGDVRLTAGDYHLAIPGPVHGDVTTQAGALLYIRGAAKAA